jgi:enoyl-CoA hydratase/carnithine racemase
VVATQCAPLELESPGEPSLLSTDHLVTMAVAPCVPPMLQRLFDMWIDFPKPIFVAANGPAIGAGVTAASLTGNGHHACLSPTATTDPATPPTTYCMTAQTVSSRATRRASTHRSRLSGSSLKAAAPTGSRNW